MVRPITPGHRHLDRRLILATIVTVALAAIAYAVKRGWLTQIEN